MCDNIDRIIFCSCDSNTNGYRLDLSRNIETVTPDWMCKIGTVIFPKTEHIEGFSDDLIKETLKKLSFDYNYDSIQINRGCLKINDGN